MGGDRGEVRAINHLGRQLNIYCKLPDESYPSIVRCPKHGIFSKRQTAPPDRQDIYRPQQQLYTIILLLFTHPKKKRAPTGTVSRPRHRSIIKNHNAVTNRTKRHEKTPARRQKYIYIKKMYLEQLGLEYQQAAALEVEQLAHGEGKVVAQAPRRLGQPLLQRPSLPRFVHLTHIMYYECENICTRSGSVAQYVL